MLPRLVVTLTLGLFMTAACSSDSPDGPNDSAPLTEIRTDIPGAPPMKVEVIASGKGAQPKTGQVVSVHYTGTFPDGKQFDSSRDRGEPLEFPVGMGNVIPGWDQALLRMHVGDRWKVTIPYQLAYGERGHPAGIPPRATLIFDMELMSVR